eukprot:1158426-Pelagomonas_calceolata.AAC.3
MQKSTWFLASADPLREDMEFPSIQSKGWFSSSVQDRLCARQALCKTGSVQDRLCAQALHCSCTHLVTVLVTGAALPVYTWVHFLCQPSVEVW